MKSIISLLVIPFFLCASLIGQEKLDEKLSTYNLISDLVKSYNTPNERDVFLAKKMVDSGYKDSTYIDDYLDFIREKPLQLWLFTINKTLKYSLKFHAKGNKEDIIKEIIGYRKIHKLVKEMDSTEVALDTSLIDKNIKIITEKELNKIPPGFRRRHKFQIQYVSSPCRYDNNRYVLLSETPDGGVFVFYEISEGGRYLINYVIPAFDY